MASKVKVGFAAAFWLISVVVFNEYGIYYMAIWSCNFPYVADPLASDVVRAMILADPHLLGEKKGAWIDRLRREWQMERSFQTAIGLLNPDVVFILGDVMDEGQDASEEVRCETSNEMAATLFEAIFLHLVFLSVARNASSCNQEY